MLLIPGKKNIDWLAVVVMLVVDRVLADGFSAGRGIIVILVGRACTILCFAFLHLYSECSSASKWEEDELEHFEAEEHSE